ncbi:MAG: hypothetical protein ACKOEM_12465 [Planctomycetia bacterium]
MTTYTQQVWDAMAAYPLRRAMLGRQQCDAIVDAAMAESPTESEMRFTGQDSAALRERWEQRVRLTFRDRCGSALLSMLLLWAIGKVVEILVQRWWEQKP